MLTELSLGTKVVGAKQVRRAVESGKALRVFLAGDADPKVTDPVAALCEETGIPVEGGLSMKELGEACGIAVGAAVAALVRELSQV